MSKGDISRKSIPVIGTFRQYFQLYFHHTRGYFFLFVLLTIGSSFTEVIGISLFVPIIEATGGAGDSGEFGQYVQKAFATVGIPYSLLSLCVVAILMVWGKGLFVFSQLLLQGYVFARLTKDLRQHVVGEFSGVRYDYYVNKRIGYLNNLFINEAAITGSGFYPFCTAIASIITVSVYLTGVLIMNPIVSVTAVVVGAVFVYSFRFLYNYSRRYSVLMTEQNADLQNNLIQFISNFKYLKATGSAAILTRRINRKIADLANCYFKQMVVRGSVETISEPIAATTALAFVCVQSLVFGESVVTLIPVLYLLYRSVRQMSGLQNMWQKINGMSGSIDAYRDACAEFTEAHERTEGAPVGGLQKELRLDDVSFAFGDKPVLSEVNLRIPQNATIAIVGFSGAGKSTLLNIITGLLKPNSGAVCIDDKNYTEIDLNALRGMFGYVSQEDVMFQDSILFNIALAEGDDVGEAERKRAEEAARDADAHDFITATKDGYDTVLGDRGITLSGGQRQRIHIARELYRKPQVLILDEATSSLDSQAEQEIQASLEKLHGKLTTIVIAHRLSTIRFADHIYVLDSGRVVEEGGYQELLDQGGAFARLVKLQEHERQASEVTTDG